MTQQHPLAPLAHYRQFIAVKLIPLPNGKTDKLPVSPFGLVGVDAHDPRNWQSWAEAAALAQGLGSNYTVGFVLTAADPLWCLDIDSALQPDGTWSPLAQQLCAALPGTVIEVSQSGTGLHVWGAGPVPEHTSKNIPLHIEFYSSRRFIALGHSHVGALMLYPDAVHSPVAAICARFFPPRDDDGEVPDDGPREDWVGPEDDDLLIQRALASQSMAGVFSGKATFADLWNGNAVALARSYPPDANSTDPFDGSSADAALAQHLAFWTGCDVARIERLMRRSALVRDKWDDRADYLVTRTIMGAARQAREVYRDPAELERRARAAASSTVTPSTTAIVAPGAVPAVAAVPTAPNDALPTMRNTIGLAATSMRVALDTVRQGVRELQLVIALDDFTGRTTIQDMSLPGSVPRPIEDDDAILIRERMGVGGAKPVKSETMRDVMVVEARAHRYDSAARWGLSLKWDGVKRIDNFLPTYWGAVDTPYTRAIGAYMWTALAGRMLVPGIKADMAPILVGDQGVKKSTGIATLAPNPEFFAELDLSKEEDDLGRQMRGKLVCELPELAGLSKKDRKHTKAFVARAIDEWVPKFKEDAGRFPRRNIMFGTTNEDEFLDDPTGERRWLPFVSLWMDNDAVARDREQLWAEGIARFQANGIEWQQAQALAVEVHPEFTISDPIEGSVRAHIAATPGPVTMERLYMHVYKRDVMASQRFELTRLGDVLRRMGYKKTTARIDGRPQKAWLPRGVPLPPAGV